MCAKGFGQSQPTKIDKLIESAVRYCHKRHPDVQRLVERKKERPYIKSSLLSTRCLRQAIRCRPHLFSFVVRRSHLQMINCDA